MIDKQFQPHDIENSVQTLWQQEADYSPQGEGPAYCIMLPPPNVTGTLHMGHGFQHTLMDALIRYHRMCGCKTLWQPGTDHAGIATQMVVERQLSKEGLSRVALGREAFLEKIWQWKEKSGNTISEQMRRIGASPDWSRGRFTMDEGLSKSVLEAFVKLYRDGLIYRGKRLVNWDPVLHTAVSDLEVINSEEQGSMWLIRYPVVNSHEAIIVATTRPETLFGDVAVAVHPEDDRYKKLIGQQVKLPLTERTIPIIADEYVDPEFGTGCVKITPAHDFNDYQVGERHQLIPINILTIDGKLNNNVPAAYQGLSREDARKKVLEDLTTQNLLYETKEHKLNVPRSEKSNAILEPYLTQQWYVRMDEAKLVKPALDVVENGEIEFVPENWRNTYRQWLTNIQDWCISRQLWWGHRIPAWYDNAGNHYVGYDEAEVRAHYKLADDLILKQDEDVLDTWFSSALWPFSTLGWPEKTIDLQTFYPTSTLVTGFDIIFFWVARMIMMGLYFTKQIPFKKVLFTGLIRDHEGQKMSKSKGNVLDPLDLIDGISLDALLEKRLSGLMLGSASKAIENATRKQFPQGIPSFGTDALRFTYCALATHGRDIRFDLERTEGYRNFCNKLWNATRFIEMQLEKCQVNHLPAKLPPFEECELPEQWLLSKLNKLIVECHQHFAEFRFDLLAQALYQFTWYEFCDWYIEFAKIRLNENSANQQNILTVLVNVLETLLRMLHPLMPFITEALWQEAIKPVLGLSEKVLMQRHYPQVNANVKSHQAEDVVEKLKDLIVGIRQIRSNFHIEPKQLLPIVYIRSAQHDLDQLITPVSMDIMRALAKVDQLRMANNDQSFAKETAVSMVGTIEILVPLEGLVDFEAEKLRAQKEIDKIMKELIKLNDRLHNENYLAKAPAEVVAKEKARAEELTVAVEKLQAIIG